MQLKLLPEGTLDKHLGISHTIKHWCNPAEMWEDIFLAPDASVSVPEHCRPYQAWLTLTTHGPNPSYLSQVYHHGYGHTLQLVASTQPAPDHVPWTKHPNGYQICHIGEGILLGVRRSKQEWRMHTAYRAADFKLKSYHCPPRDPQSVSLRRCIAHHQATQRLSRLLKGNENDV